MRRATRARELLAFDLALGEASRDPAVARPCDAPSLFSVAVPSLPRLALVGFDEAGRGALAGPVVVGCVQIPRELLVDPERVEALLGGVDDSKALTPKAREAAFACIVGCTRWAFGCASASEVDAIGIVAAAQRASLRAYRRLGAACELAVFDRGLSMGAAVALDPGCPALCARQLGSSPDAAGCRTPGSTLAEGAKRLGGSRAGCEPLHGKRAPLRDPAPRQEVRGESLGSLAGVTGRRTPAPGSGGLSIPPGVAFTRGDMRSLHVAAASLVAKVTRDHLMERLDRRFPGFGFAQHKGYGTECHRRAIAGLGPTSVHRRTFLHRLEGPESQSC